MDFYNLENYTIDDIEYLIASEIEENIHLDYKAAGALDKDDKKRTEITKDVSAFANSDGGIIVYGLSEKDNRPQSLSPVDGRIYTKEWLENVIQLIQPKIEELKIFPVRINNLDQSIYVVKIPRSGAAPHMARDKRYYKRFNFKSEPMEDYEVKDVYNRVSVPQLEILGCFLSKKEKNADEVEYILGATIGNWGNKECTTYKLNFYINHAHYCHNISYSPLEVKNSYTWIERERLKLGSPSQEVIFPNEQLDIGHFRVSVKKENENIFLEGLVIDMILFYPGGHQDIAYILSKNEYVEGRDKIEKLLEKINSEK